MHCACSKVALRGQLISEAVKRLLPFASPPEGQPAQLISPSKAPAPWTRPSANRARSASRRVARVPQPQIMLALQLSAAPGSRCPPRKQPLSSRCPRQQFRSCCYCHCCRCRCCCSRCRRCCRCHCRCRFRSRCRCRCRCRLHCRCHLHCRRRCRWHCRCHCRCRCRLRCRWRCRCCRRYRLRRRCRCRLRCCCRYRSRCRCCYCRLRCRCHCCFQRRCRCHRLHYCRCLPHRCRHCCCHPRCCRCRRRHCRHCRCRYFLRRVALADPLGQRLLSSQVDPSCRAAHVAPWRRLCRPRRPGLCCLACQAFQQCQASHGRQQLPTVLASLEGPCLANLSGLAALAALAALVAQAAPLSQGDPLGLAWSSWSSWASESNCAGAGTP